MSMQVYYLIPVPIGVLYLVNLANCLILPPIPLDYKYTMELANDKLIETEHVFRGRVMVLADHELKIDLMPVTLGNFDLVVGTDWLSTNQAEIV